MHIVNNSLNFIPMACEKTNILLYFQAMGCSFESDENCKLNTYIGTAKQFIAV